jgi:hypothetical protein
VVGGVRYPSGVAEVITTAVPRYRTRADLFTPVYANANSSCKGRSHLFDCQFPRAGGKTSPGGHHEIVGTRLTRN